MERMRIAAIFADQESLGGKDVTVCGWARTIRDMKTFGFIELNDGSCFKNLQVVMSAEELANYKDIAAQNVGAALIVKGTVVLTPDAKQPLEVKAHSIEVEGKSTPDYPLQKKRHSVEFLRTIQHLRPRTNLFSATFRVRSAAAYAVHEFFQSRGFVYVQTPIITGSDCEGAGEMFQVTTLDLKNVPKTEDGQVDYTQDFFGKKTSLTVSGQLNAENFAMAFGDVYTFGPTFRAENSNTQRHAAEFWMIEPEMVFCDLAGDMDVAEAMIKHIIRRVLERCPDEIDFFNSFVDKGLKERLEHVMTSDFGRVSYTDAVEILKKNNDRFDYKVEWGTDLQTEHERYLTEQVFKKPVFVTDYPKEIKAFYMRLNDDGKTVAAADCLVPGIGEDHRRQPARGASGAAGEPYQGAGHEPGGLLVVLRPASLRFLPPRGLRPGLRAHGDVPHRCQQHPRRGAAPPHGGKRGILSESQKSTHGVLFLSVRINIPRLGRGIFIYFVVLCAYANFRTSYKRIDGISYTIYPGEWIMSVEELSRYFRTRFRRQTLAALEGLQKKGLISFLVLGHGKLVKFKIRGWRRHNTILDYNAPCQKDKEAER